MYLHVFLPSARENTGDKLQGPATVPSANTGRAPEPLWIRRRETSFPLQGIERRLLCLLARWLVTIPTALYPTFSLIICRYAVMLSFRERKLDVCRSQRHEQNPSTRETEILVRSPLYSHVGTADPQFCNEETAWSLDTI